MGLTGGNFFARVEAFAFTAAYSSALSLPADDLFVTMLNE